MRKINFAPMVKLGFTLALFAAAACVMLAFVYKGTEAKIAQRKQADLEAALRELFPGSDSFVPAGGIKSPDSSVAIESAYEARKNGELTGVALRLSRASYGGPIKIMAGVSVDGAITAVKIMEHSDTPGLGANAASSSYFVDRAKKITFYGQFAGKKVTDPFEVKGDVAAVTASTITSRAVALAVRAAGLGVTAWLAGVNVDAVSGASEGAAE
ncbi:MAG: FMN-binding protein [Treponema sp.]|jgi:electron transport complex protein RnfG|nr:FMN-binding protein [Treponema sp.]